MQSAPGRGAGHAVPPLRPAAKGALARSKSGTTSRSENEFCRALLAPFACRAADAGAEIPTGHGEVTLVRTAGAVHNVGKVRAVRHVGINGGELARRRCRKAAGGVDDPGPNRGGNAGAADNVPRGGVIDPDTGRGVGVGGNVGGAAPSSHDGRNPVLVTGAGFVEARAAAARLPSHLLLEGAGRRVAADAGAADGNDLRRCGWPDHPGTVTGGREVDDSRVCKIHIVVSLGGKLATAKTHRNLAAARRLHQRAGDRDGSKQIAP